MDKKDKIVKGKMKVQKVMFYKNDFGIFSCEPIEMEEGDVVLNGWGNFMLKGNSHSLTLTDTYKFIAKEVEDPKWGLQYEIIIVNEEVDLSSEDKQKTFLSKILTQKQFESLYETLDNPFESIKSEDVKALTQVKGIGVATALRLIERYKTTIDYSDIYVELDGYGLTPRMIQKLIERYNSPQLVVKKIKENPYILADEVDGIGFKKADAIALKMGIKRDSPYRVHSFINAHLEDQAMQGHTYIYTKSLPKDVSETLGSIDKSILGKVVKDGVRDKKFILSQDKKRIGLRKYIKLEHNIAKELKRINNAKSYFRYDGWEEVVSKVEFEQGWKFTEQQKEGIQAILENQVTIINGYGGTGKTTLVDAVLKILKHYSFCQCALAGKAAARMAEVTGEEGYTIHRLLEYNPATGFQVNKSNQLGYDIIILDETSMVGGDLFYSLIQSINDGGKLIMLGDSGQLESIGVANIFKDMLDSEFITKVTLTQIHRQAQKSAIITESIKVWNGEQITSKDFVGKDVRGELQDLEMDIYNDKEETSLRLVKQFKEKFKLVDNIMDIQVILPMKERGKACTSVINNAIQYLYNPKSSDKKEVEITYAKGKSYILREGDKVINEKNNYTLYNKDGEETPIYNGNIGIIEEIDLINDVMVVNFECIGRVIVTSDHWEKVKLGYAITTHKSQGSQVKIAIMGLDYSAFVLLTKELVYTGMSRAKELFVLCAENQALRYAIGNSNVPFKRTYLKEFLDNKEV